MPNSVNISPEATRRAWDMVEELTFARTGGPHDARRSVAGMARDIGVTNQSLFAWEGGEYLPGLAAFVAWADLLGYDVTLVPRGE